MLPKPKQSVSTRHTRIIAGQSASDTGFALQDIEDGAGNLPAVCRVCLALDVRMYHISEHELSAMYKRVTGIEINNKEKLPCHLCWECAARLSSANNFKMKALKTHWMLSNKVTRGRFLTMNDIISIDRARHHLESSLSKKLANYDNQPNLYITKHSIATDIKKETLGSELDNNNDCNEDYAHTEILETEQENNINAKVLHNDAEPQTCISDGVMNEIDSIKRELENADNNQAPADSYIVTFEEPDNNEKMTFIVKDKNEKFMTSEKEFLKKSSLSESYKLLGCKELIVNLEDINRSKNNSQYYYKQQSANGAQFLKNNTEKPLRSTHRSEETKNEDIGIKKDSERDTIHTISARSSDVVCDRKLFICDMCNEPFHRKSNLRQHIQNHSRSYNCTYCSFKSNRNSNLRKHINSQHTKKTFYNCSYCSYKTYRRNTLRDHINYTHTKIISYNCSYCSYKTYSRNSLRYHSNRKHPNATVSCSYCSFKTLKKSDLYKHINSNHPKKLLKATSYSCSYCSYETCRKGDLTRHTNNKHTKETFYNCTYCRYKSYDRSNFRQHVKRQHT